MFVLLEVNILFGYVVQGQYPIKYFNSLRKWLSIWTCLCPRGVGSIHNTVESVQCKCPTFMGSNKEMSFFDLVLLPWMWLVFRTCTQCHFPDSFIANLPYTCSQTSNFFSKKSAAGPHIFDLIIMFPSPHSFILIDDYALLVFGQNTLVWF